MAYTTALEGRFKLDKPLKPEHLAYLKAFNDHCHVKWQVEAIEKLPDPIREAVGLPIGEEGDYFVGEHSMTSSFVLDDNHPPKGQPSLMCR